MVAYDPVAEARAAELLPGVTLAKSPQEALSGADAAVLVTEWPEFAALDWSVAAANMVTPVLVDGRNFLEPAASCRWLHLRGHRTRRRLARAPPALMQAVVLVGGEGTRLRPLTLTRPKPALALVDRPFIRFMVDWLVHHGVDDVIMACGFRPEGLRAALGDGEGSGATIRYLEEDEPLGTAGPIRLAADSGLLADRFMVLNGDVLTDLDSGR